MDTSPLSLRSPSKDRLWPTARQRCHWQVPRSCFCSLPPLASDTTFSLQFPLLKAQISWVPCYSTYSTSTVPSMYMATSCYLLLSTFWKRMHMCVVEVSTQCLGSLCLMKCLNLPGRHRSHQLSEANMWATALPPSPPSMISHHWHRPRKHWPRLANWCRVCRKPKWCLPNYFGPIRPNIEPAKGKCQVAKQSHTNVSLPKNSQFRGIQNAWENYHVPLCSCCILVPGCTIIDRRILLPKSGTKKCPFCGYFSCSQMAGMTLSSGASHSKQTKGLLMFLSFK